MTKPSYIKTVDTKGTFCKGCNAGDLEPHWGTCPAAKQFKGGRQ